MTSAIGLVIEYVGTPLVELPTSTLPKHRTGAPWWNRRVILGALNQRSVTGVPAASVTRTRDRPLPRRDGGGALTETTVPMNASSSPVREPCTGWGSERSM